MDNVIEVASVLGVAMIAVQLLISNSDTLAEASGMGSVKTRERMEELGKKTDETAAETAALPSLIASGQHWRGRQRAAPSVRRRWPRGPTRPWSERRRKTLAEALADGHGGWPTNRRS